MGPSRPTAPISARCPGEAARAYNSPFATLRLLYHAFPAGAIRPGKNFFAAAIYCPDFRPHYGVCYDQKKQKEDVKMKGYYNNSGYMGYVGNGWVLFACESDYMEYLED